MLKPVMKHGCMVMPRRQSSSHRNGSRQIHRDRKKARQVRSNVKAMLIVFSNIQGIVHKEFLPPGQTVNDKFHCEVLKWLREGIWRKCPDKWKNNNWFLHHDNVPAHTALVVQQFLTSKNITVIPHPPDSPDLAPCEFFLFPKMKLWLKGRRFGSTEEITQNRKRLSTLTLENFQGCMKPWETHWDHCIHAQEDYFEGDGGNWELR